MPSFKMTSEYVSLGHPDSMCDYIASHIISKIYEKDGQAAHAAIEVAAYDDLIVVGGEANTTLDVSTEGVDSIVREAIDRIGYNAEYRSRFSEKDCWISSDYKIISKVHGQSPDIKRGVGVDRGWNDQGIYFGYAENTNSSRLGLSHAIAKYICGRLYDEARKPDSIFGVDIKTLVTVFMRNPSDPIKITDITVAIPTIRKAGSLGAIRTKVKELIAQFMNESEFKDLFARSKPRYVINGTGAYRLHGSVADASTQGRKLVCNIMGGYAPIGGGSLIKPPHASDRTLNLMGRYLAKSIVDAGIGVKTCTVSLSGAIGQKRLQSLRVQVTGVPQGWANKLTRFLATHYIYSPLEICKVFHTYENNDFDEAVFAGITGGDMLLRPTKSQPWEDTRVLAGEIREFAKQQGWIKG